ncbi:MAG: DUF4783 domain-containing protein [Melioribacteraceae bacterium]|nr:DUF4783 domain-containing protein [Melioribacteraceae bacterium]
MTNKLHIIAVLILVLIGSINIRGQNKLNENAIELVFVSIDEGFSSGNVNHFSSSLSGKIYINLKNYYRGYFSGGQLYTIFDEFFELYIPIEFEYDKVSFESETPFATGVFKFIHNGKREESNFFISLNKEGGSWSISQVTIH